MGRAGWTDGTFPLPTTWRPSSPPSTTETTMPRTTTTTACALTAPLNSQIGRFPSIIESRNGSLFMELYIRLSAVGTESGQFTVKWPRLPEGVPLLMVVADSTLQSPGGLGAAYQLQLEQFNSSLAYSPTLPIKGSNSINRSSSSSSNGSSVRVAVCQQCQHSFPFDKLHAPWLAVQIDDFFSDFFQ